MRFHPPFLPAFLFLAGLTVAQAVLTPTSVTYYSLPGSTDPVGAGTSAVPYKDDVMLDTMVFGGTTFSGSGNTIRGVQSAYVVSGNANVNAEFGDHDTGADGNANPFVKAGVVAEGAPIPLSVQESTDAAIQNSSITKSFSSLSLNEGVDGEGASYSLDCYFQYSIRDNQAGSDNVPELVTFERGVNSSFDMQVIYGFANGQPLLSQTVSIAASDMSHTGIYIDTTEIDGGQELGVVGVDASDFGLAANAEILGVRYTSTNNSGADLYGIFQTGDASQFTLNTIPEPSSVVLLSLALGGLVLWQYRKTRNLV